jgi:hypothetical protein
MVPCQRPHLPQAAAPGLVRQYGAEHLGTGGGGVEREKAKTAHAEHYLQLAEGVEPMILGADQARGLKRLDLNWDNIRSALGYFLAQPDGSEEVLRMGASLASFFLGRYGTYCVDAVRTALAGPDPQRTRCEQERFATLATCCSG